MKPLVHLSDFLMGMVAACAFELAQAKVRAWWLCVPGFLGAAAAIAWADSLPKPLDLNSVLRPLNALLLVGLAIGCGALSSRALVYLGKSSYAMYILHVPVMGWYMHESYSFSPALCVAIVIASSAVAYCVLEEPANPWLRSHPSAGSRLNLHRGRFQNIALLSIFNSLICEE
jgi:peptidoglycan/LPS O-acetylase OafA/YrhL